MAENGPFYILTVFVLSYVTAELGLAENVGLIGVLIAVAIYMSLIALITGISVLLASETYRGDINETGPQERELITE